MKTGVLFVCLGNICRSPTVEGVFRKLADDAGLGDELHIDSAGTASFHEGSPPDPRSQRAARLRGIDLSSLRARPVRQEDFARFHHVLAMDRANLADLLAACPKEHRGKVRLFLAGNAVDEVPDPYHGGGDGFERVLDLAFEGAQSLLEELRETALTNAR